MVLLVILHQTTAKEDFKKKGKKGEKRKKKKGRKKRTL